MNAHLPLFWNFWVVGLIVVSLAFVVWFVVRIYFPKRDESEDEVVWDETLIESTAPPPLWWFWLMLGLLFFSVLYMIFYPSLGNYNGLFDLTTSKRLVESRVEIDAKYRDKLAEIAAMSDAALQANADAMQLAENIFRQNCANCHAVDARGQHAFPNLRDDEWIWGGTRAQIKHSIALGRQAVMPPWRAVLGEAGVQEVADYVQSLSAASQTNHPSGETKFKQFCAACHGADGKGNPALGAPNLTDAVWLYGGDLESIKHSIAAGRNGVMPAHNKRLKEWQIHLLSVWLTRKDAE